MEFGPHLLFALLEGVVSASILALTAMGLSIVFGVMRVVNVAHGAFFMLGAVLAWWIVTTLSAMGVDVGGLMVALLLAPLIVGVLAAVADRLILRRVAYDPERTIVATIGLLYVIQQVTLMTFGPDARPVAPPFNQRLALPWLTFGEEGLALIWPWGLGVTTYKLFVVVAATVILGGIWLMMTRTKFGLIMRATQQDREMAQACGVSVNAVFNRVFGLGAALAAMGAVLVVPIQQAHYLMGHDPLLLSFIVVIIGGLGSLPGTMVAALLIGVSDGIISVFFSPTLARILAILLVAMVLVLRPTGLAKTPPS